MKRIPRWVVIGGVRYTVERHDGKTDCTPNKARIRLTSDLPPEVARSFLDHEIDHGAFFQSGAYTILKAYTTRADECEELLLETFGPVRRGVVEIP